MTFGDLRSNQVKGWPLEVKALAWGHYDVHSEESPSLCLYNAPFKTSKAQMVWELCPGFFGIGDKSILTQVDLWRSNHWPERLNLRNKPTLNSRKLSNALCRFTLTPLFSELEWIHRWPPTGGSKVAPDPRWGAGYAARKPFFSLFYLIEHCQISKRHNRSLSISLYCGSRSPFKN